MLDHYSFVGRLAQLQNLVSKPELNDSYALIQSFLPESNRFSVRTIPPPNAERSALTIAVKLDSLRLLPQKSFYDKFPCPAVIEMVDFNPRTVQIEDGTVLQLKNLQHSEQRSSLGISLSHRFLGRKTTLDNEGLPRPTTKILGIVHVSALDEESITEFEDIMFVGSPSLVTCSRGKNITFCRCSFQNAWVTVSSGQDQFISNNPVLVDRGVDKVIGAPNVVFENCLFEATNFSGAKYGVYAGCDGTVTLLNCTIKNYQTGVMVGPKGQCVLKHCAILNCQLGADVTGKIAGLEMFNCVVSKCDKCGVNLDMTGHAELSGCRIKDCAEIGVNIRATSKHTCHVRIKGSCIFNCGDGIFFQMGKIMVQIFSTFIRNNFRFGLSILPGIVGRVELNDCHIVDNHFNNVINHCGAECTITVDGKAEESHEAIFEPPTDLFARRCCQLAGICDINCAHCGKKEEAGEKFKKCGRCENVCYCSRECQEAHWKEHKKACKQIVCKR